ncbi:MAG: M56 family metallopeptidase [Planctomycetota bacterium]
MHTPIRRYHYLVNLVQTGIETLLFFHPAVWWVSRRIRAEREHCCDDLAVAACGDATDYAEALMELEIIRAGAPSMAPSMAPSAGGGDLLTRIARLLEDRDTEQSSRAWLAIVAMLAVCTAATLPVHVVPSGGPGDDSTTAVAGRAEPSVSWDISLPSAYEMGGGRRDGSRVDDRTGAGDRSRPRGAAREGLGCLLRRRGRYVRERRAGWRRGSSVD